MRVIEHPLGIALQELNLDQDCKSYAPALYDIPDLQTNISDLEYDRELEGYNLPFPVKEVI